MTAVIRAHQIRASCAGALPAQAPADRTARPVLTADELTILTSWAEATAEALALALESIEGLTADAEPGACWRDELRLCQPSPPLHCAINRMARR